MGYNKISYIESDNGISGWSTVDNMAWSSSPQANQEYSIDFTPMKDYVRLYISTWTATANITAPTEVYFDNFKLTDGTTEDVIDGGIGNKVAFKYRIHDASIGRFLSRDPLAKEFAWNSPYAFSENRVIDAIELEGAESLIIHKKIDLTKNGKVITQKVQTWKQAYPDSKDAHGPRGTGELIHTKLYQNGEYKHSSTHYSKSIGDYWDEHIMGIKRRKHEDNKERIGNFDQSNKKGTKDPSDREFDYGLKTPEIGKSGTKGFDLFTKDYEDFENGDTMMNDGKGDGHMLPDYDIQELLIKTDSGAMQIEDTEGLDFDNYDEVDSGTIP